MSYTHPVISTLSNVKVVFYAGSCLNFFFFTSDFKFECLQSLVKGNQVATLVRVTQGHGQHFGHKSSTLARKMEPKHKMIFKEDI